MDISEIRREFGIRYYQWAKIEAEKELAHSFPALQSFKAGMTWKKYELIQMLSPWDQDTFVRASLKHYHPAAAKALGEPLLKEEQLLLDRGWSFCRLRWGREEEVPMRRKAGEVIKLASKRRLRACMEAKFKEAFGVERVEEDDPDPRFWMKFGRWGAQTSFWFGRQRNLLSYEHCIASEERIQHPKFPGRTGPAAVLTMMCWIGLCVIEWEYIYDAEVEAACDGVVQLCRPVFNQLPKLLDGL